MRQFILRLFAVRFASPSMILGRYSGGIRDGNKVDFRQ